MAESTSKKIVTISKDDLAKADNIILNDKQLKFILKRTHPTYIKERPGKGGKSFKYVSTAYVTKCLNLMFGWDWDFDVVEDKVTEKQVIVKGKLVCRIGDKTISKTQYGRKDIAFLKDGKGVLDLGNDLKAAASDALKKCASMVGVASDVYSGDEFVEVDVLTPVDTALEKEQKRIAKFIEDAISLEQLEEEIQEEHLTSEELQVAYRLKLNLLKKLT